MSSKNAGISCKENGGRRGFLLRAVLTAFGAFLTSIARAAESSASKLVKLGEVVTTHMYKGKPPFEPLDTMLLFERSDTSTDAITHEILSLEHEEKGSASYPWTIYAHLTTHHVQGDACVLCSRLHKENRGWSCGLHSEVFSTAPMVGLGVNVEMTNNYTGSDQTLLIGLNIQALGPNPCQYGIQIHGEGVWEKGIGLNGKGNVGLDIAGKYPIGIHTHGSSIRLDEGARIELDSEGKIGLRYKNGRIEFFNGDKCVGHINVEGEDHEL